MTREWGEFVYAPPHAVDGGFVRLEAEEAHHLFRVRRVAAGETVFATTGTGSVLKCVVEPGQALRVVERLSECGEPPVHISLLMAVLKGDSNRNVVDEAMQLGAGAIQFFQAERSEGRLKGEKLEKLRRVAITAMKQCGRARLPELSIHSSLAEALKTVPEDTVTFLANPLDTIPEGARETMSVHRVALVVGPEGGLTASEVESVIARGAYQLHLGHRRLRAETAAAAGLAYLLTRAGDMAATQ